MEGWWKVGGRFLLPEGLLDEFGVDDARGGKGNAQTDGRRLDQRYVMGGRFTLYVCMYVSINPALAAWTI